MSDVERVVERAYRQSSGSIRARLVRTLRDFELAEEIVHEAFAAALAQWPSEGLPACAARRSRAHFWSRR